MKTLETAVENGVLYIKFNRPQKRNAINSEHMLRYMVGRGGLTVRRLIAVVNGPAIPRHCPEDYIALCDVVFVSDKMYHSFISTLKKSEEDSEVKVAVVTGAGDYYSSGNDFSLSEFGQGGMEEHIEEACSTVQKFVAAFIDYPKLLIAVVNGPAIGIAATTIALCDVVFVSDKAWFRTPFSKLGLVPEGCSTLTFPRIMGTAKASRLLYLNETMTACEALACGFVTRIYPDSQLLEETRNRAEEYARLPLQSLMLSKKLVRSWDQDLLHRVNREECQLLGERFLSEDFLNAVLAFGQKKSKL